MTAMTMIKSCPRCCVPMRDMTPTSRGPLVTFFCPRCQRFAEVPRSTVVDARSIDRLLRAA